MGASSPDRLKGIVVLGGITGRKSRAERLVMRREFAAIQKRRRCKRKRKLRVYSETWPNPRISSPPWVAELISIHGGEATAPAGQKVTDEQVAQAVPDVIILAWAASGDKANLKETATHE